MKPRIDSPSKMSTCKHVRRPSSGEMEHVGVARGRTLNAPLAGPGRVRWRHGSMLNAPLAGTRRASEEYFVECRILPLAGTQNAPNEYAVSF